MKKIGIVITAILLNFYGAMLGMIPEGQTKPSNHASDYINWVDYWYKNPGYHKHKEPKDIYKHGCKWGTWVTFPNKIAAIELKVGRWEHPEELFRSQDFIAMYKHPDYYVSHILDYLSNPNYTEKQKQIAIYGLENLPHNHYLPFTKSCYELYKQQRLSEALLKKVLSFEFLRIHPLVIAVEGARHTKSINELFLKEIQTHIGATTSIGLQIEEMLSGRLAKAWSGKEPSAYIAYKDLLPFSKIICDAYKEVNAYYKRWEHFQEPYKPPYFLMIHDHPAYYHMLGIESETDVEEFLRDPSHTNMEKRLAIFAMQKVEGHTYNRLMKTACRFYYWDHISVHVMQDLLQCSFLNFCKYPFFILDYKSFSYVLDEFISLPTLPCGLRKMAQKVKKGKLATAEEMAYIEKYRAFCKTHFTLYETIPPRK